MKMWEKIGVWGSWEAVGAKSYLIAKTCNAVSKQKSWKMVSIFSLHEPGVNMSRGSKASTKVSRNDPSSIFYVPV